MELAKAGREFKMASLTNTGQTESLKAASMADIGQTDTSGMTSFTDTEQVEEVGVGVGGRVETPQTTL